MNVAANSKFRLSDMEFARLGGGQVAYVREIEADQASELLGQPAVLPPGGRLYCLYAADGSPLSIAASKEAAVASAMQHELVAMTVH